MLKMSQSFCMGTGGIEHNLRIKKGNGVRQNGVMERRFLNEYPVIDESLIGDKDYVQKLIHNVVEEKIKDGLEKVNEKHISRRQLCRVKSVDQWIENQQYTRNGKPKPIAREYVIQIGNKFTGCPFEFETDKNGNMVDAKGKVIPEWDTRKKPVYKNGIIKESAINKKLKKIYKQFVKEFEKANPQAKIISCAIHCDEQGGCHMHINCIWFSETKKDVGYGLAATMAIKQQLEKQGIKCNNTRTDNPTIIWKNKMRELLEKVALENGIERLDMNNHEKHKSIYNFCKDSDARCEAIEAKVNEVNKKEKELTKKISDFNDYAYNTAKTFNKNNADLLTFEGQLEVKEFGLKVKEKSLADKEDVLNIKEDVLNIKEKELSEKEQELSKDIAKQEWYLLKKYFPEQYQQVHNLFLKNKNKKQKSIYNINEL